SIVAAGSRRDRVIPSRRPVRWRLAQPENPAMRIDFVSDVACPWCAIGLNALERALERIGDDLGEVELHMQPFELNPTLPPEGIGLIEYLTTKYGLSP